jgi:ATP-dependent exoDNAse (exonuclease V) beta subunit
MSQPSLSHLVIQASAGSGKTHQLTNRYLALLVGGAEPEAILAATFTRKAAGEILDRCLERLARAAADPVRGQQLAVQLGMEVPTPPDFTGHLRTLLQGLHRVRIGTLDSFSIALAGSFGLELGLPAAWSICEEVEDDALRAEALDRLLDSEPDEIGQLVLLLSKGEVRRSIHAELLDTIAQHYESFRGSERAAWEKLQIPPPLEEAQRAAVLEQLRNIDFSTCQDKRLAEARDQDVLRFEAGQWLDFLSKGLAARIAAGETTYQSKPIPGAALPLYTALVQHAGSEALSQLGLQTRATWDLLARFHEELWTLKQATGGLRFGEVTQVLVDAFQGARLRLEDLAFRLDGAVDHLLLDEFQDTSLAQWRVLAPLAQRITRLRGDSRRSFFCVGDVKQAIYGWRGGMPAIFGILPRALGALEENRLEQSRRSAPPIIDVVNKVFGNLHQWEVPDKHGSSLDAWGERFKSHTTAKVELAGYVCLQTGPAQGAEENVTGQRSRHCQYVASQIASVIRQAPGASFGVLCRTNDTVARIIYELGRCGIHASEEGGSPLTDSPAVDLILSLFILADHGDHSIADFHVRHSPLAEHLKQFADADALARRLRRDLLAVGCGLFVHDWARRLAPSCDARDLRRLQQLVETAYAFQSRSTLRAADFVEWVRRQRVPDPTASNVRVMTIHAAKGLQFDAVVLPELDTTFSGRAPRLVVDRDPASLEVTFVCRYADESMQKLLKPDERQAFNAAWQQQMEESLSLLYVAMTRPVHALYLFIPGPRDSKSSRKHAWYNLLRQTLAPGMTTSECRVLCEHGESAWHGQFADAPELLPVAELRPIVFATGGSARRRGLEQMAPSRREGEARVALAHLFHPSDGTGTLAGTIYHAWFATIGWLEDGLPTKDTLLAIARRELIGVPMKDWPPLEELLQTFQTWLDMPVVNAVLRRAAYVGPGQPGFPAMLAPIWRKTTTAQQVERERRFLHPDDARMWNGSFDRIVWLCDGDRTTAAHVIDFKTDAIAPGDDAALAARSEHYRPQLEAYRRAAANLGRLAERSVAVRLVFTCAGRVVDDC